MAYEVGGRADKRGNRFEYNWVVSKLLEIVEEKIDYITIEAIGDDEKGIDLWIGNKDGSREGQQCKGRNASKEYWTYGDINARGIFENWKKHLEQNENNTVSLVSPLAFTLLEDLTDKARNTSNNALDFYEYQIKGSSKENRTLFNQFCNKMGFKPDNGQDLVKAINYLSRIFYRQSVDSELKNTLLNKIDYIFMGKSEDAYSKILDFVFNEDIWGKKIDIVTLDNFFEERGIALKNLSRDTRILPQIKQLNNEYKNSFISLNNGLIGRKETIRCNKAIEEGKSLIIHGKAGIGKSGCLENIISYCENNTVPYLAIKLDKRVPNATTEVWSKSMGLPASITHCLHSISKEKRAVIILDQLDALRWTQAHSGEALSVCFQIINEVDTINKEREHNISIVMACRTYDLENDHNISNLFKSDKKRNIEWAKIQIEELDEEIVESVIGKEYQSLSTKIKSLLKVPSNLYIWERLDKEKSYNDITTTHQLVSKWWSQLERKANDSGITVDELTNTKNRIVTFCENKGRIYIPKLIVHSSENCLNFLCSNGFIIMQSDIVSFVHQSILDSFFAQYMLEKFYEEESIEIIIGALEKQTPGRRYQVQMFMQQLLEISESDFLSAGTKMLESQAIRYNVKYVFLEILSQISEPSNRICEYIGKNIENELWGKHIINNVILGRKGYVHFLREKGILDNWMADDKRNQAIDIITSITPKYNQEDCEFIKKYIFQREEEKSEWMNCFYRDINEDLEEIFEIRIQFYERYPNLMNYYLDFKTMMEQCEVRTIRLLALMLKNKIKKSEKILYRYEELLEYDEEDIFVKQYREVIDILLPFLPKADDRIRFSDWSGKYIYSIGIERVCIQLLKKANRIYAEREPNKFWDEYQNYMGTGNELYNEIILDAMYYLPDSYSNEVIEYVCKDFDKTLFEDTSGNKDKLLLAKNVIGKFSKMCSNEWFDYLQYKIIHYISPRAKERYEERIAYNKENYENVAYWNFWGNLQRDLLEKLPDDRLSVEAKNLKVMLKRRFANMVSIYHYNSGHSGSVFSPVSGKKLTINNWKGILTNKKIKIRGNSRWIETEGGFIDNSLEEFSRSFGAAVSENPVEMIEFMLNIEEVSPIYVDSMLSAIAYNANLENISIAVIEQVFQKFKYDYESHRASYICKIIEKRKDSHWSDETLKMLEDIAVNHTDPLMDKPNVTTNEDKEMKTVEMLESNAINSVRGSAAETIGALLWEHKQLFDRFKGVIENLTCDNNPAVRYASLYALFPSYNIDREWAAGKIVELYRKDYRMAGFHGSKDMFFQLYKEYQEDILLTIMQCYKSDDNRLVKIGGYSLAEMYILNNEFEEVLNDISIMSKEQMEAILEMLVVYFNISGYNEHAKQILERFLNTKNDIEHPWSRLFYDKKIDLNRDKDFVKKMMSSLVSRRILYGFVWYLEKEGIELLQYSDVLIDMCNNLLDMLKDRTDKIWGVEDQLSKLVIALYDETYRKESDTEKAIANECLNIWDRMYEEQIGSVRRLTSRMMEL